MASFSGTVQGGSLNLRQSCNTSSTKLASIPNGTSLTVSTVSGHNDWFQTSYSGQTGCVLAQYIAVTSGVSTCTVTTTSGSLNIRQTPSTSATVLYTAAQNSTLYVLDTSTVSGWYRVSSSSGTGWGSAPYLTISGGSGSYPTAAIVDTSKHGDGGTLNLRASASSSASVITTIPNGATIYVASLNGTWLAAQYGSYTGYVMAKFVIGTSAYGENVEPTDGLFYAQVTTSGGTLNVRETPSGDILGVWPNGRIAICETSSNSGWYKTRYAGNTAYVNASYMTIPSTAVQSTYVGRMSTIYTTEIDRSNASYFDGASGAWCQLFVNWLLRAIYVPSSRVPTTSGTGYEIQFWVNNATFYFKSVTHKSRVNSKYSLGVGSTLTTAEENYVPVPGDVIYFRWSSETDNNVVVSHTGIVTSVSGGYVNTIEGNKSSKVGTRSMLLTNSQIVGYGKLDYTM